MWKSTILSLLIATTTMLAADPMPVARQNDLVQKYCTVCHTNASMNGGLSLEHYDAASAEPSLAAMMLSKLTSGVEIKTVQAARSDPAAAAVLATKMKMGAMGAAGLPVPDQATVDAFVDAFAAQSSGADQWSESRDGSVVTVSVLDELPSATNPGEAAFYRLILSCDTASGEGRTQLAWAPMPRRGTLLASADGQPPVSYAVDGTESMGNGSGVMSGPAAVYLEPPIPLPAQSLRVSNLFPDQQAEFSFEGLTAPMREALSACAN